MPASSCGKPIGARRPARPARWRRCTKDGAFRAMALPPDAGAAGCGARLRTARASSRDRTISVGLRMRASDMVGSSWMWVIEIGQ